jgi:Fucose 4-O-acetylase and related acetyltransferases
MKRIEWIDAAKAIGILLVIMGHTSGNALACLAVDSFHIPLFFFLSGYTYNRYSGTFGEKARKSIKSYLFPYFVASAMTILLVGVFGSWYYDIRSKLPYDNILPKVKEMLYDTVMGHGIGMLWFLSSMFCTKLAMNFLAIIDEKGSVAVLLILAVLAPLVKKVGILPWNLDVLPVTLFFCYLGFYVRKKKIVYNLKIAAGCVMVWGIALCQGISLDINGRWFSSIALANACLAIYALLTFVRLMEKQMVYLKLDFWGKNSLYLFIIHHLERMEISYIWEAVAGVLDNYIGGFTFWIIWGMRSCMVITVFIILYVFCSKFNHRWNINILKTD